MRLKKVFVLGASMVALALVITSCGSTGGPSSSSSSPKASVTVGALNFPESAILAQIYGQALKGKGYSVSYKLNLGSREVVEPALERGDINLFPDYAATELEFQNKGKGEATPDAAATVTKLNTYLTVKRFEGAHGLSGGGSECVCGPQVRQVTEARPSFPT